MFLNRNLKQDVWFWWNSDWFWYLIVDEPHMGVKFEVLSKTMPKIPIWSTRLSGWLSSNILLKGTVFAKLVTSRQLFFSIFTVRRLESVQALNFFSSLLKITVNKFKSGSLNVKVVSSAIKVEEKISDKF